MIDNNYQNIQKTKNNISEDKIIVNDREVMKKLDNLKNTSWRYRKDSRIELRFYKNNKQYSIYGWTQEEVLKKYKEWKPKKKKTVIVETLTFYNWFIEWRDKYKKNTIAESTLKSINYTFTKNVLPFISNKPLKKINTEDIQEIINSAEKHKRQQTIMFNFLNNCFKKAYQLKKINTNPCDFVEINKVKQIKKGTALTYQEQLQFIDYLDKTDNELKNLFKVYLFTGMRRSEALNITLKDLDFCNNTITIKGTKTTLSNRVLPTSEYVMNLFGKDFKGFNFNLTKINQVFRKACKELNFSEDYKIHSLRHTFATRCLENGINIKVVQKWLGHSTIKMTSDVYSHVQTKLEQEELKKINNFTLNFTLKNDNKNA